MSDGVSVGVVVGNRTVPITFFDWSMPPENIKHRHAKRFAHASDTSKAKASQIPESELNQWGYPNDDWMFVGFGKYTITGKYGQKVMLGFTYWVRRED
tara:strand:- start:504 stop:797 length:294 start_codon:yes stop_codon:yes gene_type:complete